VERFNLINLSELEGRKQYQIEIANRFATLKNLSDGEDINRAWENINENIKTSAKGSLGLHELKKYKPRFEEKYLRFLDRRKHDKMQWVQHPNQNNVYDLINVRREASRHFRGKNKVIAEI